MYWIALANRNDQWHTSVVNVMISLGQVGIVTTDEVLNEFLAYYSGHGPILRKSTQIR